MSVMETIENEVLQRRGGREGAAVPVLSAREVEVLLAWFASDSKESAAAALFISQATVSTHIARVRAKYAAAHRAARSKTTLFARLLEDGYTDLRDW